FLLKYLKIYLLFRKKLISIKSFSLFIGIPFIFNIISPGLIPIFQAILFCSTFKTLIPFKVSLYIGTFCFSLYLFKNIINSCPSKANIGGIASILEILVIISNNILYRNIIEAVSIVFFLGLFDMVKSP